MTAETTLRCAADFRNVIGIKEASGDIGQMQRILDNRPEGFLVLSGDDGMAIELMRRGGDGVISVAANAFPQRFMECVNHAKAGDFDAAEKAYAALDEAVHALFEEGNPVGVKCALGDGTHRRHDAPAAGRRIGKTPREVRRTDRQIRFALILRLYRKRPL